MSYVRTPEHRHSRSGMIHQWRPWERSTGPRTPAGKARASRNGWKGGMRETLRQVGRVLQEQKHQLERL